MIAGIEGKLMSRTAHGAVIKVGGVRLSIQMPTSTLSALGNIGDKVDIHTHLYVKDDNLALYGFAAAEEIEAFRTLLTVTGIGPKVALAILSALSPGQLAMAVSSGNIDLLAQVPGVGKKTAGRLLLELKDKLVDIMVGAPPEQGGDVIAALIGLGYSPSEAASALASLSDSPELTTEEKIRLALQHFAGR
ncbi:MAG: Holliday junction branch migration protein RuvA [Chloroflexota bacterium]|nr:Holliday junction branch migration protein RuvA [Chloroflexota bacterium]